MKTIYVDNNATTQVAPEVYEAMVPYLTGDYFNPSSMYEPAQSTAQAVSKARETVAKVHQQLDREVYAPEIISKAERLYERCMEKGRLSEALGTLKYLAELYGVAPGQQVVGMPVVSSSSRPEREGRAKLRAIIGGKGTTTEPEKPKTSGGGDG